MFNLFSKKSSEKSNGLKLIVGLGNPGIKYQNTRHNLGSRLVEFIAKRQSVKLSFKKKLCSSVAQFNWEGTPVLIACPETYMNLSGKALRALTKYYSLNTRSDLLVAVDDVSLQFGRLRLRPQGSAGGHNGLKSIDTALQTQDYARLKMGIGAKEPEEIKAFEGKARFQGSLEDYVLQSFLSHEVSDLPVFLEHGYEACQRWLVDPMEQAMSSVNHFK